MKNEFFFVPLILTITTNLFIRINEQLNVSVWKQSKYMNEAERISILEFFLNIFYINILLHNFNNYT